MIHLSPTEFVIAAILVVAIVASRLFGHSPDSDKPLTAEEEWDARNW